MAARRLIIVMLVLLGISTAIAIVAPDPAERAADSGTTGSTGDTGSTGETASAAEEAATGTTGATEDGGATGSTGATGTAGPPKPGTIEAVITVSREVKPVSVCARPGSRLILTVRTRGPIDLSVPDFGRTSSATRYALAVFDLLMPEQPGSYDVETLATGRTLATITSNDACARQKSPTAT